MIESLKDLFIGRPLVKRSKSWSRVKKAYLEKNPRCELCASKKRLEVHHIIPVHKAPGMELDATNLMTLCRGRGINCHLLAHKGNWKDYNPHFREQKRVLGFMIWGGVFR